MTHTNP